MLCALKALHDALCPATALSGACRLFPMEGSPPLPHLRHLGRGWGLRLPLNIRMTDLWAKIGLEPEAVNVT